MSHTQDDQASPMFTPEIYDGDQYSGDVLNEQKSEGGGAIDFLSRIAVATEVSMAGSVLRYGGYVTILSTTNDSVLSTAYLMASTAVVEGSAALAAPVVINSQGTIKTKIDKITDKFIGGKNIPLLASVVIANYLGVSALEYARSRGNPALSDDELRGTGIKAAACLTIACGVQGYAVSKGFENISEPKITLPIVGVLASAIATLGTFKRRYLQKVSAV